MKGNIRSAVAACVVFLLPIAITGNIVWHTGVPAWGKVIAPIGAVYCWTILLFVLSYTSSVPFAMFDRLFPEELKAR